MFDTLNASIVQLGFDLFSIKLYWMASSTLWVYEYFLTLGDEVEYAWKGRKTAIFWVFFLNRYTTPCFIVLNSVAYFSDVWTADVFVKISGSNPHILILAVSRCNRSGFIEGLQTLILTSTAEIFLTLRVYAITRKSKIFPCLAAVILAAQWGSLLYAMIESRVGKDELALLISSSNTPLPTLPDIDPYHICMFIYVLNIPYLVEAVLYLSFAFDAIVFLIVMVVTFKSARQSESISLIRVIQRDGVIYFFVLFSSNLVWVLLLLHVRPGLKFMHNQPSAVISAIMVNRITLNLKAAYAYRPQNDPSWRMKTLQTLVFNTQHSSITRERCSGNLHVEHEVSRAAI